MIVLPHISFVVYLVFALWIPVSIGLSLNTIGDNTTRAPDLRPAMSILPEHTPDRLLGIAHADTLILTQKKVKDWMKTRIKVAKLQNRMKADAAEYDNLIEEFYSKREELLKSRNWPVEEFEAAKKRIHASITAMDMADELEESRADHEEEIENIKSNEFYSKEQKEEMIKVLQNMREQKLELYIQPTKPDWPAVEPYRTVFQQMTGWIAGNRAEPPDFE